MPLERPKMLPTEPELGIVAVKSGAGRGMGAALDHPGYGLTARGLIASYRHAEAGYPDWQCDVFDDKKEVDAHLRSQLEKRRDGVAKKPWILQAGGEDKVDQEAARLLEGYCRRVPNFTETLGHQSESKWYGYSFSEIDWDWDPAARLFFPAWFANAPHRRFRFDDEGYPLITSIVAPDGAELEPGKWWCSYADSWQDAVRRGLMRTATWYALFKTMAIRDWIVFADRFGLPYVTGEHEPNATPEDKATLKRALMELGKEGAAMFSKLCKIVVHWVETGGKASDVHGAIVALCNAEISKLVTGATLTSETGGPGSFALGNVHADEAYDLRAGDAEDLALRFEMDVGRAFCEFNRIPARPPRLKIQVVRDLNPETRAKITCQLANELGLEVDEDQIRQEHNLKRPSGPALRGTKAQAASSEEGAAVKLALAQIASIAANDLGVEVNEGDLRARLGLPAADGPLVLRGSKLEAAKLLAQASRDFSKG